MPDWIYAAGGILATLTGLVTAFWQGWIWTKPQVDRSERQYDNRIKEQAEQYAARLAQSEKERLEWREIALSSIKTIDRISPTLDAVLSGQAANKALLEALRKLPIEGGS